MNDYLRTARQVLQAYVPDDSERDQNEEDVLLSLGQIRALLKATQDVTVSPEGDTAMEQPKPDPDLPGVPDEEEPDDDDERKTGAE